MHLAVVQFINVYSDFIGRTSASATVLSEAIQFFISSEASLNVHDYYLRRVVVLQFIRSALREILRRGFGCIRCNSVLWRLNKKCMLDRRQHFRSVL